MTDLEIAQKQLIALYEKVFSYHLGFLVSHHQLDRVEDIEEGKRLRELISKLEEKS
jgi:hypothetical protein